MKLSLEFFIITAKTMHIQSGTEWNFSLRSLVAAVVFCQQRYYSFSFPRCRTETVQSISILPVTHCVVMLALLSSTLDLKFKSDYKCWCSAWRRSLSVFLEPFVSVFLDLSNIWGDCTIIINWWYRKYGKNYKIDQSCNKLEVDYSVNTQIFFSILFPSTACFASCSFPWLPSLYV